MYGRGIRASDALSVLHGSLNDKLKNKSNCL